MKIQIDRLVSDPEVHLFNYIKKSDSSEFLIIDEEDQDCVAFMDTRMKAYAKSQFTVANKKLAQWVYDMPKPRRPQFYIFHHANVCSTLLARCMAQSDAFFSLKEPNVINRLSRLKAGYLAQHGEEQWTRFLDTHLRLLAKQYKRGDMIVLKVNPKANNLMTDVLKNSAENKLIYLHSTLVDFLVSILKKAESDQRKVPQLLKRLGPEQALAICKPEFSKLDGLGFLQQSALLWVLNNLNFLNCAETRHQERVATLNVNDFLASPRSSVKQASCHFHHEPSSKELDQMAGENAMQSHAVECNQDYDQYLWQHESNKILGNHGRSIEQAWFWIEPLINELEIEQRLQNFSLLAR